MCLWFSKKVFWRRFGGEILAGSRKQSFDGCLTEFVTEFLTKLLDTKHFWIKTSSEPLKGLKKWISRRKKKTSRALSWSSYRNLFGSFLRIFYTNPPRLLLWFSSAIFLQDFGQGIYGKGNTSNFFYSSDRSFLMPSRFFPGNIFQKLSHKCFKNCFFFSKFIQVFFYEYRKKFSTGYFYFSQKFPRKSLEA